MAVEGVILAAGFSSRANGFKPEFELDGKTLIENCVISLSSVCERILVVGGHRIDRLRDILTDYGNVEIIFNKNYELGMFSSVLEGARNVQGDSFFLLPGDYPRISSDTFNKMLLVDGDIIIPSYHGQKGHPVLFKKHLTDELLSYPEDSTLRDYIHSKGFKVLEVNDQYILKDVDTREDYELLKKGLQPRNPLEFSSGS